MRPVICGLTTMSLVVTMPVSVSDVGGRLVYHQAPTTTNDDDERDQRSRRFMGLKQCIKHVFDSVNRRKIWPP